MDLVNTVRKEGSRGGRADFKWSDVQADQHRENYLGHSVMAPVGRWQRGKDLQWYSRNQGSNDDGNDGLTEEERARKERQEEIARIKLAEREALNKALGYEVNPDGPLGSTNGGTGANATAVLGDKSGRTVEKVDREKKREHRHRHRDRSRERDGERRHRRRRDKSRSPSREHRRRHDGDRSRSRDRTRRHDHRDEHRSRRNRSRSPSRERNRPRDSDHRARSASRSPYRGSKSGERSNRKPDRYRNRSP